jgi:hypothetical protein
MKNLMMVAIAVCFAVFAVNANAATLTVAHTDLTLAGGVSASYNYVSDPDGNDDQDHFTVDSALLHFFKDPTVDSPLGGHLALAAFDVKTVTGQEIEPTIGEDNFRPWLAYASYLPVENLTLDAGLLWPKFGEAPVAILNSHITRPVAFIAQPVAFAGARLSYDAGMANFYIGYNDGSALDAFTVQALDHGNPPQFAEYDIVNFGRKNGNEYAFEVGACVKLVEEMVNVAVNYFDYDEGYDTINASIGVDMEKFHAKVEANWVKADTKNTIDYPFTGTVTADEDTATTYALYACCKLTDTFKLPLRLEFVDDNDSLIYASYEGEYVVGYDGWNVTVSPTYMPTKNAFIKLEGVYAKDDDDVFRDDDGVEAQEDDRYSAMVEFGFIF